VANGQMNPEQRYLRGCIDEVHVYRKQRNFGQVAVRDLMKWKPAVQPDLPR
jgi:hypothetical protein